MVPGVLAVVGQARDIPVVRAAGGGGALLGDLNEAPIVARALTRVPVGQVRADPGFEQELVRRRRRPLGLLHALEPVVPPAGLGSRRRGALADAVAADLLVPEEVQLVALRDLERQPEVRLQRAVTVAFGRPIRVGHVGPLGDVAGVLVVEHVDVTAGAAVIHQSVVPQPIPDNRAPTRHARVVVVVGPVGAAQPGVDDALREVVALHACC